jgi:hypothetical protein
MIRDNSQVELTFISLKNYASLQCFNLNGACIEMTFEIDEALLISHNFISVEA